MSTYPYEEVKVYNQDKRNNCIKRCKEKGIIAPTFAQQKNPDLIPEKIKNKVKDLGVWDDEVLNLFRVTWKNNSETGLYGDVNFFEIPKEITGVDARIVGLVGKYFPTGAHKVGATYGCLAPRMVTGQFDPVKQKAVWPSTGNYCRGGAFVANLLACDSVAILPEEMSQERFDWLEQIGAEVFATPGCESNVKEIFDKCWELKKERGDNIVIFNQFEEYGNPMWHYEVTGSAIEEVFNGLDGKKNELFAFCSATGSAGTLGAGEYLKKAFPKMKIAASEALQCPTLLNNGFGGHRIEGIGDKHVPFIHNARNTDFVVAIDDNKCMSLMRLFNDPKGHEYLKTLGVSQEAIGKLSLMGISGISNMLSAVKMAKYNECTKDDVLFTVFTDSMDLYGSRMAEQETAHGKYSTAQAAIDYHSYLKNLSTDNMLECGYNERKRIHNLKYFTWVEQQERDVAELNAQWYDHKDYFDERLTIADKYDKLIEEFNKETGLLDEL